MRVSYDHEDAAVARIVNAAEKRAQNPTACTLFLVAYPLLAECRTPKIFFTWRTGGPEEMQHFELPNQANK
jgi:hypothetical protein